MRFTGILLFAMGAFAQTYRLQSGTGIQVINSEEYVAGAVTGEGGNLNSDEALRALSIAVRTFAAHTQGRHASEGFDFCSTTHCQRYVPASARAKRIALQTSGQFIWFHGKPALTLYSRSCGGRTEDVRALWPDISAPYLIAHGDPYCRSPWTWGAPAGRIREALLKAGLPVPADLRSVEVMQRTSSGRAQTIALNGRLVSASALRFAMGRFIGWNTVRSDQYNVENAGPNIVFHGAGEGHGVGLCQQGADNMGFSGRSFREILAFYYPGTSLRPNDLKWTRLSGEGLNLYSADRADHRAILAQAEAFLRHSQIRLPWAAPRNIDLYLYPDLESFRNVTGEPGWVAARATANRVELQPKADRHVLQHELAHVLVESAADADVPLWFREGIVEYLSGAARANNNSALDDSDLRQRTDSQRARSAYRSSQARVERLIHTYGEAEVLRWVVGGLPVEVKYSNNRKPAVRTK